jgi:type IV pilus assembly protein PilO
MTLDELNKLNFRDIGNWPLLPKIAVLVILLLAILAAGYWFDWSSQLETLDASREQEAQLKETFLGKKKQAINLEIYKQQLKDIEQSFGALLRQLPNKSEMDALLTDINQAGLGRGLQFDLFKPSPQETITEFYAERPINIRVTGSYHDLGAFASDISQLSRIVTLDSINVTTGKGGDLVMDGIARTYRYLDDDEVAAQKKAAKSKKGAR